MAVGLPFDWHLPPTRRDGSSLFAEAIAGGPCQPSPESPYAVLRAPIVQEHDGYTSAEEEEGWSAIVVSCPCKWCSLISHGQDCISKLVCREDSMLWGPHAVELKHLGNALALWKRFTDAHMNDLVRCDAFMQPLGTILQSQEI